MKRAADDPAFGPDSSAVRLDDALRDVEAESKAAPISAGLMEPLEDRCHLVLGDADSRIAHHEMDPMGHRSSSDRHLPPAGVNLIALPTRFESTCWIR